MVQGARAAPVLQQQRFFPPNRFLGTVAIAPLEAVPSSSGISPRPTASTVDGAALIARFLSEALTKKGVNVIPAGDVSQVLADNELAVPSLDPVGSAEIVAREFGATALIVGQVSRYTDREGGSLASVNPSSVSFQMTLYSAPEGKKVWTGRFAHTQSSLTDRPLEATRLPGRGTRWLSAGELARWGVDNVTDAITSGF